MWGCCLGGFSLSVDTGDLAVCRNGERWEDKCCFRNVLNYEDGFVCVLLCFITLYLDKMFVAVKFLLASLQMSLEVMTSCFYALMTIDFKGSYQRSGSY